MISINENPVGPMATCKTCKHFQRYPHPHKVGNCKSPHWKWNGNACLLEDEIMFEMEPNKDNYRIAIMGQSFSCIHHEPK